MPIWQIIITAGSVVTAFAVILKYYNKGHDWVNRQNAQDAQIKALGDRHDEDIIHIKKEMAILVRGQLACLKGLQEQGYNGPVTAGIKAIEDYLNQTAHE